MVCFGGRDPGPAHAGGGETGGGQRGRGEKAGLRPGMPIGFQGPPGLHWPPGSAAGGMYKENLYYVLYKGNLYYGHCLISGLYVILRASRML